MKKLFVLATLLISAGVLRAQDSTGYRSRNATAFVPVFGFNNIFLGNDYLMGFSSGCNEQRSGLGAKLEFDFRPYFKRITIVESDSVRHQYREKDFFLNLALEKQFRLKTQYPMLIPFVQVNFGLLWGNFKAFAKAPENKWIASPSAGLYLAVNPVVAFKLGYQYLKPLILASDGHRITLQINLSIDE